MSNMSYNNDLTYNMNYDDHYNTNYSYADYINISNIHKRNYDGNEHNTCYTIQSVNTNNNSTIVTISGATVTMVRKNPATGGR